MLTHPAVLIFRSILGGLGSFAEAADARLRVLAGQQRQTAEAAPRTTGATVIATPIDKPEVQPATPPTPQTLESVEPEKSAEPVPASRAVPAAAVSPASARSTDIPTREWILAQDRPTLAAFIQQNLVNTDAFKKEIGTLTRKRIETLQGFLLKVYDYAGSTPAPTSQQLPGTTPAETSAAKPEAKGKFSVPAAESAPTVNLHPELARDPDLAGLAGEMEDFFQGEIAQGGRAAEKATLYFKQQDCDGRCRLHDPDSVRRCVKVLGV